GSSSSRRIRSVGYDQPSPVSIRSRDISAIARASSLQANNKPTSVVPMGTILPCLRVSTPADDTAALQHRVAIARRSAKATYAQVAPRLAVNHCHESQIAIAQQARRGLIRGRFGDDEIEHHVLPLAASERDRS